MHLESFDGSGWFLLRNAHEVVMLILTRYPWIEALLFVEQQKTSL